jgi:glycosyltransferase involved in cell wall biosynthesis
MKIALFYNLPAGGGRRCIFELTKILRKKHTVDLYNLSITEDDPSEVEKIFNNVYTFDSLRLILKKPLGTFNIFINFFNLYSLGRTFKKMAKTIDTGGYDLAFVHASYWDWLSSPDLLRYLRTPSVYFCHEPYRKYYESQYFNSAIFALSYFNKLRYLLLGPFYILYNYWFRIKDSHNIRQASVVLTNSFFSQKRIAEVYGISAKVNYLGVDEQFFRPLDIPKENMVISVGVLESRRGHHFVIEALSRLPEQIRPRLIIISPFETEEMQAYKEQLSCLAAGKKVDILFSIGISDTQLCLLYNQAKLTICVFIREPFGLVPLESMACATAVVAVAEAGLKESVVDGQTGRLVIWNMDELAHAIEALLLDEKERIRLGCNGRQEVLSKWTWRKSAQELEQSLLEAIKDG